VREKILIDCQGERQAREAGPVAFFPKPLDLDGLAESIRAQLGPDPGE
jgi:hypothetical protein